MRGEYKAGRLLEGWDPGLKPGWLPESRVTGEGSEPLCTGGAAKRFGEEPQPRPEKLRGQGAQKWESIQARGPPAKKRTKEQSGVNPFF